MQNKKQLLLLLPLLFVTIFIYSASFKNQFIWDDFYLIVNDATIRSFMNLPFIFKTNLFQIIGGSNFYRPLQTISFAFDYFLWGLDPLGYHLTNLMLHLANIVLIYFFVSRIFTQPFQQQERMGRQERAGLKNYDIAFLTSLIFAVHPINTEAVTYISGRADPLCAFFFLSALLFYARFKDTSKKFLFILSLLFFIFSLLTKEAVLIFPLILILYDAMILKENRVMVRSIKLYTPYLFIIIIYVIYRLFFLGLPFKFLAHISFKPYLLTLPKILILYLGLLLFPINLYMERIESLIGSAWSLLFIVPLITIICAIWLFQIFYRRSKPLFFCAGFFFITLLPVLNILVINAMMAEHWLYLPSIGVYAILSFGLVKIVDFQAPLIKQGILAKSAVIVFIGFLSFFSIRTILRNIEWGRPFEFYSSLLEHSPYSERGHINIGVMYLSTKDLKSARREFLAAARLNPGNPFCYHGLGFVDFLEDNKPQAMNNWRKALDINPFFQPTRNIVRGSLYKENKKFRRLLRAVEVNSNNITAEYLLAKIYLKNGLYLEALDRLQKVLEINPNSMNAVLNRSGVYYKLGLYTKAIADFKKYQDLNRQ